MDDLISRQAAIDAIHNLYAIHGSEGSWIDQKDAFKALNSLSSAQPEIIRCKDCVYFTPEKSGEHWNICRFYDAPKTADGFCNDAERKEE